MIVRTFYTGPLLERSDLPNSDEFNPFQNDTFGLFQLKEFADEHFEFDENGREFS